MKSLVLLAGLSGGAAVGLVLGQRAPAEWTAAPPTAAAAEPPAVRPARAEVAEVTPAPVPPPPAPVPAPPAPPPPAREEKSDGVMVGPDGVIYERAADR